MRTTRITLSVTAAVSLAAAVLLLPGCEQPPAPHPREAATTATAAPSAASGPETGTEKTGAEGPPTTPTAAVELQVVKWPQLQEAIKGQKGKVVVLDVWANWCIPCKHEFPGLVRLHRRYAGEGVQCMSVTLDEASNQEANLAFLRQVGATFPNYLLDEETAVWQEKFDINGPPAVFVYDRSGRQAARFDHNNPDKSYTYDDVEKLVKGLLGAAK